MRVARIRVRNFRCIRHAEIFPVTHNVLLGPNNAGKTAVLEALNLALNPDVTFRTRAIDENDFFRRQYLPASKTENENNGSDEPNAEAPGFVAEAQESGEEMPKQDSDQAPEGHYPTIYIEVVLAGMDEDDEDEFSDWLVPWREDEQTVVEGTAEGENPFQGAERAIRIFFEAWFDPSEDDFFYDTFFLTAEGMDRDECTRLRREHKRHIGFLIYRDFRALTRPVTLDPRFLFGRLMSSQEAKPRRFEEVLESTLDSLEALHEDDEFAALLNSYKAELERFLPLTTDPKSKLTFDLTDRTRVELKTNAQMYTWDSLPMPIQKMGAGTRSLAILSILTLIMRRRGRGILALEEPETFLFPHAQRRVIDECLALADQTFVTTHSPFVLERIPIEGVGRIRRDTTGLLGWSPLAPDTVKKTNLYSRFLRKAHCEALVGNAVIVVEGDSDRWWLSGAGRALNRQELFGRRQEALELQGIAVVPAESDGGAVRLGEFFHEAELKVVALLDRIDDPGLQQKTTAAPFPCLCHKYKGLEELLTAELPVNRLRQFLTEAPHAKGLPLDIAAVAALSDVAVRSAAATALIDNKGAAFMHEWLIGSLAPLETPHSLAVAIDLVSRHFASEREMGDASILGQ